MLIILADIDNCTPNPCQNSGTCIDGVASYTCMCAVGFTGPQCTISKTNSINDIPFTIILYLSLYPLNTFQVNQSSISWKYFPDIDDCDPNPCNNGGVCTDGIDSYTCTCAEGYTGVNCDESMFQIKKIDTAQDNIINKSKNIVGQNFIGNTLF